MCLRSKLVHKFVSPPPLPPLLRPPSLLLRKCCNYLNRFQVATCIIHRRKFPHTVIPLGGSSPLQPPPHTHTVTSLCLPSGPVTLDFLPVEVRAKLLVPSHKAEAAGNKRKEYIKYFRMVSFHSPALRSSPAQVKVSVRLTLASVTMQPRSRVRQCFWML